MKRRRKKGDKVKRRKRGKKERVKSVFLGRGDKKRGKKRMERRIARRRRVEESAVAPRTEMTTTRKKTPVRNGRRDPRTLWARTTKNT